MCGVLVLSISVKMPYKLRFFIHKKSLSPKGSILKTNTSSRVVSRRRHRHRAGLVRRLLAPAIHFFFGVYVFVTKYKIQSLKPNTIGLVGRRGQDVPRYARPDRSGSLDELGRPEPEHARTHRAPASPRRNNRPPNRPNKTQRDTRVNAIANTKTEYQTNIYVQYVCGCVCVHVIVWWRSPVHDRYLCGVGCADAKPIRARRPFVAASQGHMTIKICR